jgi:HPt (histidine-containing phosphotransfer) domain-containing protein
MVCDESCCAAARPQLAFGNSFRPVEMNPFSENKVLDLPRLRSLYYLLGASLRPLVVRFFEDCSESLESITLGIARNDAERVRKIVHQMKGASSSIGLKQLEAWFSAAENSMSANAFPSNEETAEARRLLADAKLEFDRFFEIKLAHE